MVTPESSRDRLLHSGKHLFATRGYENTSTIAIARAAGTSESQLMKHFGSKDGLLEAIFEYGWQQMAAHLETVRQMTDPLEKLRALVFGTMEALERDKEIKELMLMEARRIRKQGNQVLLTNGFIEFMKLMDSVLRDMRNRGQLRPELKPEALRSAIIGLVEGMLRDEMLSQRMGFTSPFSSEDMRTLLTVLTPAVLSQPARSGTSDKEHEVRDREQGGAPRHPEGVPASPKSAKKKSK